MLRRLMDDGAAPSLDYDFKGSREDLFKDLLADLNLHHPPCQELRRNRGFYALAALAHTLARAVDILGGRSPERGRTVRQDGRPRRRPTPRRMRVWRFCRRLIAVPAVENLFAVRAPKPARDQAENGEARPEAPAGIK